MQNPTGTIMSVERRTELLRLAAEYGVPVFEDDRYADLVRTGERPPALYAMSKRADVIHIGSFSKSIAPALRASLGGAVGDHVAHAAAQDRRGLGLAGTDDARRILHAAFCEPRARAAQGACAPSSKR